MAIGGFHDVIVGPIAVGQILEVHHVVSVRIHEALVRAAAQHVVHDGSNTGAGDGGVRTEGAVIIAIDPAVLDGADDGLIVPVALLNVREDVLAAVVQLTEAHGDHSELRTGHSLVGLEGPVRVADDDAQTGQRADRGRVPVAVLHIRVLDVGGNLLVQQQVVEHLGHLGAGHVPVGAEGAVGVAVQESDVILRVQPARDAGILGIRHGEAPLRIDGHIAGQGDRGHSGGQAAVGAPALEGVAISGRHIRGQIDDGAAALADGADLRAAVGVEGQLVGSTDGAAATAVRPQRHGDRVEIAVLRGEGDLIGLIHRQIAQRGGLVLQRILEGVVNAVVILIHILVPGALFAAPECLQALVHDLPQARAGEDRLQFVIVALDAGRHFRGQRRRQGAVLAGRTLHRLGDALRIRSLNADINVVARSRQSGLREEHTQDQRDR